MGTGTSVEMEDEGVEVQSQGEKDLWSVLLDGPKEGKCEGVCVFTRTPGEGTEADLCCFAIEHLRVLRHPNLLKFLNSEISRECIWLVTEPVLPLLYVLKETSMEVVVMGWRGVGSGLSFLHDKAGLSHNNLSVSCVYVNTLDSLWKVGGMEAAAKHTDINAKFLSAICDIRHASAVPPEDKAGTSPSASVAVHARDVWAWGNFMLAVLEEAGLEAEVQDSAFQYINDNLLNPEPNQRPLISTILSQPWMSNLTSYLTDFLGNLTLKDRREKDKFFCSLPQQLHSLPPSVLAENVVPLLMNPLVLAEPLVRDLLWKHLLLPASPQNPRTEVFKSVTPCPLLEQDLFKAHLLPLLLNLLESREYHVRLTLLHNLSSFVSLCNHDDLVGVVLPEVLVGLKDLNDDLVQATFHALGDLVPYTGADVVLGTPRKRLFTDAQPRLNPLDINSSERLNEAKVRPQSSREKMKEKHEQQRLKRMSHRKLGQIVPSATLQGGSDVETTSSHQYSPSISHDEVESEPAGGSGTSTEGLEVSSQSLVFTPTHEQTAGGWAGSQGDEYDEKDDESESETDELEEEEDKKGSGENWSGIASDKEEEVFSSLSVLDSIPGSVPKSTQHHMQSSSVLEPESTRHHTQTGNNRSSKIVLKSKKSSGTQGQEEERWSKGDREAMAHRGRHSGRKGSRKKKGDWKDMGAREDEGNEKQLTSSAKEEPDLFADMAPKITSNSTALLHEPSSLHMERENATLTKPASGDMRSSNSAFVYQPQQRDATSGDWEGEDWGDNF